MGFWGIVAHNWFDILSAIGIVGGLVFTAVSFHSEAKTRRVANLIALTQNHRELWKGFYEGAQLSRIFDPLADIANTPISLAEETFIKVIIQHLASFYRAMKSDLTIKPEGIRQDVRQFLALPIPKAVWEKFMPLQDHDFVAFVEGCL